MNIEPPAAVLQPEIVSVIGRGRLIDSQSEEHVYWRRDGRSLAAGYYVVAWPAGTCVRRFNEDALLQGPFRSATDARPALMRAIARQTTPMQVENPAEAARVYAHARSRPAL